MSSTDSYDFKYAKENIEYTSKFGKSLDEAMLLESGDQIVGTILISMM